MFSWTSKLEEKMIRCTSLFCNYDLGHRYEAVAVNEMGVDSGEDPVIKTVPSNSFTNGFIIL